MAIFVAISLADKHMTRRYIILYMYVMSEVCGARTGPSKSLELALFSGATSPNQTSLDNHAETHPWRNVQQRAVYLSLCYNWVSCNVNYAAKFVAGCSSLPGVPQRQNMRYCCVA